MGSQAIEQREQVGRKLCRPVDASPSGSGERMDMKLEVVVVPVSDVDRAKEFYKGLGFREDIDYVGSDGYRVVQLTPPGSPCSIIFGKGVTSARPGSIDRLVLAVHDIDAARAELVSHGVDVRVFHDAGGGLGAGFYAATALRAPGPDPQRRSYASYASFTDPDGNGWLLQEITERLPGRV
jgi:catechol 2,3-dioxygenase-like lactoylglutathione lyase family enzyme